MGKIDQNERELLRAAMQRHGNEIRVSLREYRRIPEYHRGYAFDFLYDRAQAIFGGPVTIHVDTANEMIIIRKHEQTTETG